MTVRLVVTAPVSSLSTIRRCDKHKIVHHDHSKTTENEIYARTVHYATCHSCLHIVEPARLQWCVARSCWNHAAWGRIVFNDEFRFELCPDDNRRCVWRYPGSVPILLSLLHATQALNQVLWSGVPFRLTAGPLWSSLEATYSTAVCRRHLRTVLLPFLLQYPGLIFQQDNVRPYTTRVLTNCLTAPVKHFLGEPDRQISLQSSTSRI
ncbi:transposable element Tc1 transposase [Trichonephila clavipes]|nr:transposable element Tc1 transposase [Trichonephila clavipes]